MRTTTQENIDKIMEVLRENRDGIWIEEIARRIGFKPNTHHVHYYIYGQIGPNGKKYGGYLEDDIEIVKKEGNNIYITLKKK